MKMFVVFLFVAFLSVGLFFINAPLLVKNNQEALISDAKKINQSAFLNQSAQVMSALPESLKGTEHGVILKTNDKGELIIDRRLRDLFEYYLSAMGEESLDVILKRIQAEFYAQLPASAIEQAKSLLKDYVDYRIELANVNHDNGLLNGMLDGAGQISEANELSQVALLTIQKNTIAQLRNQYFNNESYQAFFEKEDILDKYMLSQLSIVHNQDLNEQQKQQQIAALQETLPEEEQQLRKRVSQHSDMSTTVKGMRSEGSTDEAVFQHRAQILGEGAAQNLAILDKKRAQWKGRLDNYASERNDILASGLSERDAQLAISDLINRDFSEREGRRVKALDSSL